MGREIVVREKRNDGWANFVTGAGTYGRDKTSHTFMEPVRRLGWGELESLRYGDWVCARIIKARPKEYFRRGFELEGSGSDVMNAAMDAVGFRHKLKEAFIAARWMGGALAVCGIDDGLPMDQPLNLDRARGVKFVNVVDLRYANPIIYYDDASQANFGEPQNYQITPAFGQTGMNVIVHESRCIRFLGTEIDPITARRLAGWSYSCLQEPYDVVRRIAQSFQAAGQLMYDVGQGVLKVHKLVDQLTGPNQAAFLARLAEADMSRWAGKQIVVDAEHEDFTRAATPLAGVKDLMEYHLLELGGAAEMPQTQLFGRSPAGQNSTGESDTRVWYDSIASEQSNEVEPKIKRFLGFCSRGKWDGKINWVGLQQPDDFKEAQVQTERAKKWEIYESIGAVSGEQVALVEMLNQPIEEVLDQDALETIVKAEYEMAKAPPPLPTQPTVSGVPIKPGTLLTAPAGEASGAEPTNQNEPAPKKLPPAK